MVKPGVKNFFNGSFIILLSPLDLGPVQTVYRKNTYFSTTVTVGSNAEKKQTLTYL